MELRDTPEQARFRAEVRRWLEANLPDGWGTDAYRPPETGEERVAFARQWQRKLYDGGWAGLDWPREYGGRAASFLEQLIWSEEYARVRGPDIVNLAVGLTLAGPTLIGHGTERQKERFLRPILRGNEIWCQGFSEPAAGSDLAGLQTRGEVRGDEIVVTGQKIWTSFAQHADWCILVVRTDPDAPRHAGLTFLLVDMKSSGITVRPLREMTGEAWFNEVFFDAVRVPAANVVGELNGGWHVVITTLSHERGSSSPHARLAADLSRLVELARHTRLNGRRAVEDPVIRQELGQFAIEIEILRLTAYRNASVIQRSGRPGPEGSTMKLFWSELDQRMRDAATRILGPRGVLPAGSPRAIDGDWCHELLWSRAATIYAGTSEVQRNIIADRVLRLPRDR